MKIKDTLIKLIIFLFVIASVMALTLLISIPNFSTVVSAIASIILAIGTFFMVYVTYESYKTLAEIQKRSFDPYLSVTLWKHPYNRKELLSDYGVTIKNDGSGMAENVVLTTEWILNPTKNHNSQARKYVGEGKTKIGRIASKEEKNESFIIGAKHYSIDQVWGVKIVATCEDIFGNEDKKYSDTNEIFLPDAEIKPISYS